MASNVIGYLWRRDFGFNTAIPIASAMIWAMERCAAVDYA